MNTALAQKNPGPVGPIVKTLNNPLVGQTSLSFLDHSGERAVSSYWGKRPRADAPILPPQWSFQFYITYGATIETATELPEQLLAAVKGSLQESYPIRLDVYYLPNADVNQCIQHYRAEKATRLAAGAPLPLVDPYTEDRSHMSVLIQVEHADWEAKGATIAFFDIQSDLYDEDEFPPDKRVNIKRNVEWGQSAVSPAQQSDYPKFVGEFLRNLKYGSEEDEMNTVYHDRVDQGHSDWT